MSFTFNNETGEAISETVDGVTVPIDYSFKAVNDFVHSEETYYEELQWLCLGMANEIERLNDSKNVNKNKKDLFEEAALKKGYSLDKDGGKYADAWLEEAWQVHQLVE